MIRTILKVLAFLIIAILMYNYFLGTEQEKKGSEKIFSEIKDVGVAVTDLLKEEKEKFDRGKYDQALEKINWIFSDLKEKTQNLDRDYDKEIRELETEAQRLKEELKEQDQAEAPQADRDKLRQELDHLLEKTRGLIDRIQPEEQ